MRIILTCLALAFISTSAMAKGKSATTIEDCKSEIKSSKKEISSAKADAPATETYLRVEKTCVNALGKEDRRYYQKVILKGCETLSANKGTAATVTMQTCMVQGLEYITGKSE